MRIHTTIHAHGTAGNNFYFFYFIVLLLVFLKVGMTHSYGNGRRLDDSKALAELNFEVKHHTHTELNIVLKI